MAKRSLLATAMLLFTTLPALADFPALVTAASGLVLRDAPSATGRQLALLPKGASCTAIDPGGREDTIGGTKARWWRIKAAGQEGWAFGAFLAPAPLTVAWLTESSWFCDEGNGIQLTLLEDGKCQFDEAWDGGISVYASWTMAATRVRLTVPTGGWNGPQPFAGNTSLTGGLAALPDSLYSTLALTLTGDRNKQVFLFRLTSSGVPAGAVRVFEGRRVVILAPRAYVTTDNAMLRETPSPSGKTLPTRLQGAARELPYLPKGTTVSALWRTEQKSVAAGRSDFWYRVQVVVDRELYPVETGWVFGAFLEALPE